MGNDVNSAFPAAHWQSHGGVLWTSGMTLRDYFAAKAMQSLLTSDIGKDGWATVHGISGDAYKVADAMLEARK